MAYLRARRSLKLGPGVRLNLNKRSMGLSVAPRGAHYSFNTAGRRQSTVGIPGSGLSWISVHSGGSYRSTHRAGSNPNASAPAAAESSDAAAHTAPSAPLAATKLSAHPSLFA